MTIRRQVAGGPAAFGPFLAAHGPPTLPADPHVLLALARDLGSVLDLQDGS